MGRLCEIIANRFNGKKTICIDTENKELILNYVCQSKFHLDNWRRIIHLILEGHKNTDLYEQINEKCIGVAAMKFFYKNRNEKIYCKEEITKNGVYVIVTDEIYLGNDTNSLIKNEILITQKITNYEYEIQQPNSD